MNHLLYLCCFITTVNECSLSTSQWYEMEVGNAARLCLRRLFQRWKLKKEKDKRAEVAASANDGRKLPVSGCRLRQRIKIHISSAAEKKRNWRRLLLKPSYAAKREFVCKTNDFGFGFRCSALLLLHISKSLEFILANGTWAATSFGTPRPTANKYLFIYGRPLAGDEVSYGLIFAGKTRKIIAAPPLHLSIIYCSTGVILTLSHR